jgi:hypothetical protein
MSFSKQVLSKYRVLSSDKILLSKTYETWSHEDTKHGDTDDKGWEFQNQEYDSAEELVDNIDEHVHPSSGPGFHQNVWYSSTDGEEDYKSGDKTFYAYHIKAPVEVQKEIYELLKKKFKFR